MSSTFSSRTLDIIGTWDCIFFPSCFGRTALEIVRQQWSHRSGWGGCRGGGSLPRGGSPPRSCVAIDSTRGSLFFLMTPSGCNGTGEQRFHEDVGRASRLLDSMEGVRNTPPRPILPQRPCKVFCGSGGGGANKAKGAGSVCGYEITYSATPHRWKEGSINQCPNKLLTAIPVIDYH